jgi:hypothetical protein
MPFLDLGRRGRPNSIKNFKKPWSFSSDVAALTPATASERTPVVFSGLQVAELRSLRERRSGGRERKGGRKWIGPVSLAFYRRLDRSGSGLVRPLPLSTVRSCLDPYGSIWRLLNLSCDPDPLDFGFGLFVTFFLILLAISHAVFDTCTPGMSKNVLENPSKIYEAFLIFLWWFCDDFYTEKTC